MNLEAPEGYVKVASACQENPDLWFSDNDRDKIEAKLICLGCPFKVLCKSTAIENREKHGIWGGTDFSTYRHAKHQNVMCRKGKHKLPEVRENNRCEECRKDTQKAWMDRQSRDNTEYYQKKLKRNSHGKGHKNVIGGKCKDGHELDVEGKDYFIRTEPAPAIVCKKCIHKPKNPQGLGGLNSGSRNHG